MRADIAEQLSLDPDISHIVFTGHSAGGAVASLVFLHFVSTTADTSLSPPAARKTHGVAPSTNQTTAGGMVKYSLLTFGSAPSVTVPDLGRRLLVGGQKQSIGLMMAFVNEYDLVARADKNYLRSVIDLYRSRQGLPMLWTSSSSSHHRLDIAGADAGKAGGGPAGAGSEPLEMQENQMWPLPPPVFHLVGDIVVLGICLDVEGGDLDDRVDDSDDILEEKEPKSTLKAEVVTPEVFTRLLFCDIGVHRRAAYLKRVDMLVGEATK